MTAQSQPKVALPTVVRHLPRLAQDEPFHGILRADDGAHFPVRFIASWGGYTCFIGGQAALALSEHRVRSLIAEGRYTVGPFASADGVARLEADASAEAACGVRDWADDTDAYRKATPLGGS